jgi:hypothetical protein
MLSVLHTLETMHHPLDIPSNMLPLNALTVDPMNEETSPTAPLPDHGATVGGGDAVSPSKRRPIVHTCQGEVFGVHPVD